MSGAFLNFIDEFHVAQKGEVIYLGSPSNIMKQPWQGSIYADPKPLASSTRPFSRQPAVNIF